MFFRLIDTLLFTIERILQHKIMVLWVLVGLSVATTLALSLSLYVDSVYTELLASRLNKPPYAFRYRYLGAWNGNIGYQDMESATVAVTGRLAKLIELPVANDARFVRGGSWSVQVVDGPALGTFSLGTLEGAGDLLEIVDGEWPPTDADPDIVPALMPESMMYKMGLQVGDELSAQRAGGVSTKIIIAAMWRPANENDPNWIFTPKFFDQILLVEPETLQSLLEGVENPIDEAAWWLVFDGAEVRTSDVSALLGAIVEGERTIDTVLPGIRHDLSPAAGLRTFQDEVDALAAQLFIIIAPVGGLVLYFVALVAELLVSRQGTEDVKLRSRGMSRWALLSVHVLMWLIMVGAALGIGVLVSPKIVTLIGKTSSFLRFDDPGSVREIVFTPQAVGIGAATGLIAASSGLFLAWRRTRQNINSYRRQAARASKAWWQKVYLDVLLAFPAGYVLYTLMQSGGIQTSAETPFSDPLAFIGPTLFALSLTMLFLRLWPALLGIGAKVIAITRNMTILMALRELTRGIGRYRGALLMMAFTLSLTGFTASMASTLDRSLEDTVAYKVGADMVLVTAVDAQTESAQDDSGETTTTVTGYNVPPVEDLYQVDGIAHASRVGYYAVQLRLPGQLVAGEVLGMDRGTLAAIAHFREDYASRNLAAILNELAGDRTGLIIDRGTLETYGLALGQQIEMQVNAMDAWYTTRAPVVAVIDYFPTLDPREGFFALANIDPIFELVGSALPHDVWLALEPGADPEAVKAGIEEIGFPVLRYIRPEIELQAARAEPSRRGVFGFLSVGFVASIALTLIAAVIQSTASFQAQSTQLGALRAMGLGGLSVAIYVILLQGLVALSGILSGTAIGIGSTLLYLPLLDFSGGLPPYLIRVAWDEIAVVYAVFAGVLFAITTLTTLILSRAKLATVIRLGDI